MALVFSPLLPTTTFNGRVRTPLKQNRSSYCSSIKCCSPNPGQIPLIHNYNGSKKQQQQQQQQQQQLVADASVTHQALPQVHENVTAETLTRDHFPADFLWGAGTSAIQIEGDATEGGRGPSTGDYLIRGKGVNSYHMYKDDVKLLKDMNMPYYRFSIAWPRILPDGTLDNVNPEGIQYYHKLLDELEDKNIIPMATLLHFDLPQALKDKYNGFMDRRIIKDFTAYCDLCFKTYGHRIKHWISINEASTFILFTDCSLTDEQKRDGCSQFLCLHNLLLAHASVYRLYEQKYKPDQHGEVGMTIVTKGFVPHSYSVEDASAAELAFAFHMGCYFDTLCFGDYPEIMKVYVRDLPAFSDEEKRMLKQSFDFLGINYYFSTYVQAQLSGLVLMQDGKTRVQFDVVERSEKDGVPIGPFAPGVYPIHICPEGLKNVLLKLRDTYGNPKIYITETGCSSKPDIKMSVQESLGRGNSAEILSEFSDDQRLGFIRDHLLVVYQAMKEKVNVKGFIAWSLMDNTEFGSNEVRFGLNFVDYYDNYKRYPKKSALWFKDFLSQGKTPSAPITPSALLPPMPETTTLSAPVEANTPPLPVS